MSLDAKAPANTKSNRERLRSILPDVWALVRPRRGLLALGFVLMVINRLAELLP